MKLIKVLKRVICDFIIVALCVVSVSPLSSFHNVSADADELDGVYTKTFTISAYYSPLPCQEKYATGTYKSDIRLNGNGTNGADGTEVYPGMIAAPSTYAFGTKMYIPGIGTVAVHDRGGAIVESNGTDGVYDRLDIWMGYGDIGLKRALDWGKRTLDVTVYGVNSGIIEEIYLSDYSPAEAIPNECVYEEREPEIYDINEHAVVAEPVFIEEEDENAIELDSTLSLTLQFGDQSDAVLALQAELNTLNFYKGELNGVYDELTQHAVFKFQQSQYLVGTGESAGAGIFGPKTKDRLNEIISARNYTNVLVAVATQEKLSEEEVLVAEAEVGVEIEFEAVSEDYLVSEMDFGMVGGDVSRLQQFLKDQGYFNGLLVTDYFGPVTRNALLTFQIDNNIVSGEDDLGAGRVGPNTLAVINNHFIQL